jgi:hypothetical protein
MNKTAGGGKRNYGMCLEQGGKKIYGTLFKLTSYKTIG